MQNKIGVLIGCFMAGLGLGIAFTMGDSGFLVGFISLICGVGIIINEISQLEQ